MNIDKHGFMGLMDHVRTIYPVSRDWEDIDCSATACIFNGLKKCNVPSIAKIGKDGRCGGFKVSLVVTGIEIKPKEESKEEAKEEVKEENKDDNGKAESILI